MNVTATPLEGVYLVETTTFEDHRGFFSRLFCTEELQDIMESRQIQQINHSCTRQTGTVRGLHLQNAPFAEMKLIRCIKGRVWDVAVDLRKNSKTFLQWHGVELTSVNRKMFIIPEGCAHGFQTAVPESEMLYLHTASYATAAEFGIHPQDPALAIDWPLKITELSVRDGNLPCLSDHFAGWTP